MADKLTSRQLAQLAALEPLPQRFAQIHRLVEEIAGLRADDATTRRLCRSLDESRASMNSVGLTPLSEQLGVMGMLARRGAGIQMKVRGLREGLAGLKINYEGALRSAKTPESRPPEELGTKS